MYVELLVIKDLFLNYVVLMSVGILLNRLSDFKKIFFSSSLGTIDLIFLFLNISNMLLIFISLLLAFLMSIISFSYKNWLYTTKNIVYIYLSSIFYGGVIYLINVNFFFYIDSDLMYTIILLIIIPIISFIYIKSIKNININHSKYYKVSIYFNNHQDIEVIGFLDTGNKLVDPYFFRPIILLSRSLIKNEYLKKIYVPYNTVNNHSLLECIIPDKLYINGKKIKIKTLVGLINEVNIEGAMCILNEKVV